MIKLFSLASVVLLFCGMNVMAQFSISGSVGKDGTYATLTGSGVNPNSGGGVFAALNDTNFNQAGAAIVVTITGNSTSESALKSLGNGPWASVTIRPSGGVMRTISGSLSNNALILLSGATHVTIDGLNDLSGNALTFTNTGVLSSPTIEFVNGASQDTIRNCTLLGANPNANQATLYFSTGANNNNVISSCVIAAINPSSSFSVNGVLASVLSAGDNNQNTVSNCTISDFFSATASSSGIAFKGSAANATGGWTITGNKIFQTVARTITSGSATIYSGITATSGSGGWTISNNVIGYANTAGTGRTTYTCAAGTTITPVFKGIEINGTWSSALNNIDGNTIAGISFTTNSVVSSAPGVFSGISTTASGAYLLNVGVNAGNIIGTSAAPDSAICNSTAAGSSSYVAAIYINSSSTVNIKNNSISGIVVRGTLVGDGFSFNGIHTNGTGVFTVSGDTVGGSGSNDIVVGTNSFTSAGLILNGIQLGNTAATTVQSNIIRNLTGYSSASGAIFFNGIYVTSVNASNALNIGGTPPATFGNTISNLNAIGTNSSTAPSGTRSSGNVLTGINISGPAPSATNIKGNTVSNCSTSSITVGSGLSAALVGIYTQASVANITIDSNVVNNLSVTSNSVSNIVLSGITLNGASASGNCLRNHIYGLNNNNLGGAIAGINTVLGTTTTGWTVYNNMISIMTSSNTIIYGIRDEVGTANVKANYYYNSIYIGGTISSGANGSYAFYRTGSATELIKDNIFVNERTGGTAKNYCIANAAATPTTGWALGACNYNILGSSASVSTTIGLWGSTDETFANWRNAGASNYADVNSLSGVGVNFTNVSTGDLHIHLPSQASGAGTPIAGITIDIDGVTRSTGTPPNGPTMGANELPICNAATISTSITYPLCNGANTGSITLTATGGTPPLSYQWSNGQTTQNITNLTAGNYSVSVTDAINCLSVTTAVVTQPALLIANCSRTNVTCNGANNGTASISGTGGTAPYLFSWSNGATTSSITFLVPGTYIVTITDINSCNTTCSATITQPTALSATCSGSNISCHGANNGNASVTATGGTVSYHYTWSNGSTVSSINGLSANNYAVTVADANGCTATCAYSVTEPATLSVTTGSNSPVCVGSVLTASSNVTGGTTNYSYSWTGPAGFISTSANATINSAATSNSGTYAVVVTDAHGCTASSSTSVTVINCITILNLKLFTQGYYLSGGLMQPVLFNEGISNNQNIVDTFTVELHNASAPYAVAFSNKLIVNVNGTVTDTLPYAVTGTSYYIGIKHRNTIETWSASPVLFSANSTYDFTNAITKAYGNNMTQVEPGVWAFYTGDINQDCNIDLIDFPQLDFGINHGLFGYFATDLNGDGNVDLLDFPVLDANINSGIFCQYP